MQVYRRSSTWWQMGAGACAFAVVAVVLESGALFDWAQRLEVGRERRVAVPVMAWLHGGLARWGMEGARRRVLAGLVRVRWSEDSAPMDAAEAKTEGQTRLVPRLVSLVHAEDRVAIAAQPETALLPRVAGPVKVRALLPLLGTPPLVSALPAMAALPVGGTRTVALVGDSMMAVGLGPMLLREAPQYKNITLIKGFRSGTGLARPEVFDWQRQYPAMVHGATPEVVIVAMGANDGQGFVQDGVVYEFGSQRWMEIYQQRVQAFLEMLEADGATVVWVGLPAMKQGNYDARMAVVNRIAYSVVSASPHAVWFSTAGLLGDSQGAYEEFGRVHNSTVRLRAPDGIHWSDEGAGLVTAKLLAWMEKRDE